MTVYETYDECLEAANAQGGEVQYVPGRIFKYNVAILPKVGDDVSKAFNGDYYPAGQIVAISKSGEKITTSTGEVFRRPRRRLTDAAGREFPVFQWRENSGPFCLIEGTHDERNPHF